MKREKPENHRPTVTPKISLFVCTTPRSGSSYLAEAIELTEVMGNPGEWLHPIALSETRRWLDNGPDAAMDLVLKGTAERFTAANGVFAVKLMWSQVEDVLTELRRDDSGLNGLSDIEILARAFPNPHIIYLTRRDLIAQAISLCRAGLSNKWLDYGQKTEPFDDSSIDFNFVMVNHSLTSLREDNRKWRQFLETGNAPVLELEYEEIVTDYQGTLGAIAALLDIREGLSIDPTLNRYQKMRDTTSDRWTREFEETITRIEMAENEGIIVPNPPDAFDADITVLESPDAVLPSEVFQVRLQVRNLSGHTWRAVGREDGDLWNCLTSFWYEGSEQVSVIYEYSASLPFDLAPGMSTPVELPIIAPDRPGTFRVLIRFVQTGVDLPMPGDRESTVLTVEVGRDRNTAEALRYFQVEEADSEGWIWTDWLGSLRTIRFPWVNSTRYGWLFCQERTPETKGYWFFRKDLGWFWADRDCLPLVWSAEKKEWLRAELTERSRGPSPTS